ncbi:M28 family peptidase [Adhaeribacter pallidiroseus]|nr:M28 family peptidase [Adhaeribacter pallidiroseus]
MRPSSAFFLLFCLLLFFSQASFASQVDTLRLRSYLLKITETPQARQYQHLASLNQVADYLRSEFLKNSSRVTEQVYRVNNQEYRNIICSFGPEDKPRIIIGAHYDVCQDQPGADDNASGVAGLLELSHLLAQEELNYRVDLVAFTLEEPPFFRTEHMGSFVHAQFLKKQQIPVLGMISLEMIGYFSDQKHSQQYPLKPLKLVYGSKGNFITVVQKWQAGTFARQFYRHVKQQALLPVKKFKGPAKIPGMDFSDHLNYWRMGYSAFMITDTSFYRNPHYHLPTDTLETLNLTKMGLVLETVYQALIHFNSNG